MSEMDPNQIEGVNQKQTSTGGFPWIRASIFVIVLAGVLSNMASDVGYVLLVPLGARNENV